MLVTAVHVLDTSVLPLINDPVRCLSSPLLRVNSALRLGFEANVVQPTDASNSAKTETIIHAVIRSEKWEIEMCHFRLQILVEILSINSCQIDWLIDLLKQIDYND